MKRLQQQLQPGAKTAAGAKPAAGKPEEAKKPEAKPTKK